MSWLIPREDLSGDQIKAIELDATEHRIILGAPGSGKTQILLHRARHLIDELGVDDQGFRIFVFTNVLKDYIRAALDDLELPEDAVITLDDWCYQYHQRHISERVPWNRQDHCPDFDKIREVVLEKLRDEEEYLYSFVMVEEGQDLDAICFEILKAISPHITVCMDHKQQIYNRGSEESEVVSSLGLRRSNVTLLDAFRCCPYIVHLAAAWIPHPDERKAFLNQGRTRQTEIQTPLYYRADSFEDELRRVKEVLRERQTQDRSIALLFPTRYQVGDTSARLMEFGFELEIRKDKDDELDFGNNTPKVLTFHSAKGLTFDTVLMPTLNRHWFKNWSTDQIERLLFVGVTRATKWVYLSSTKESEIEPLDKLDPLVRMGYVTVQKSGDAIDFPTPEKPLEVIPETTYDDIL